MTWDPTTKKLYTMAFNIAGAEVDGDDIDAPFGLFSIDPTTGRSTEIGYEETASIISLAADSYGQLYGIDDSGNLWEISKRNGRLGEIMCENYEEPSAKQDATFDLETGVLYWNFFNADYSHVATFTFGEESVDFDIKDDLPNHTELIGLWIDTNPNNPAAPAVVTDFTVTPAANGVANATLAWVNPTKTVGGSTLSSNVDVTIYRDDAAIKTLTGLAAGASASYIDENVAAGMHTYKVVASNEVGTGDAVIADAVYIGVDTPGMVTNLTATKSASNKVALSWSAPSTGAHNGWFDNSALTYTVVRVNDNTVVAQSTSALQVSDEVTGDAAAYTYTVTAASAAGAGATTTSQKVVLGAALSVPYSCDFSDSAANDLWTILDGDNDGWKWEPGSYNNGLHYMKYYPADILDPNVAANDWAFSAPIELKKGENYHISYDLWGFGELFPVDYTVALGKEATVSAMTDELEHCEWASLQTAPEKSTDFIISVEEDGTYYLGFGARSLSFLYFSNVLVESVADIDLTVTGINGSASAIVGETAKFEVSVRNVGAQAVESYSVSLKDAQGNLLGNTNVPLSLSPMQSATIVVRWTPTETGTYAVTPYIYVDGDKVSENNSCEPLMVTALNSGLTWYEHHTGSPYEMLSPFALRSTYAAAQTLYLDNEVGADKGKIYGLKYYYNYSGYGDLEDFVFNAKVWMGNADYETNADVDFEMMDLDEMTKVYEGTVTLTAGDNELSLLFDEPFEYDGDNLVIRTENTSEKTTYNVSWYSNYTSDYESTDRSFVYSYGEMISWNSIPDASFLSAGNNSSVQEIASDLKGVDLKYDAATRSLTISGDYRFAAVYTVGGVNCGRYAGVQTIDLSALSTGIYILQVVDNNGASSTLKLAL
jgi:hypothetical protein